MAAACPQCGFPISSLRTDGTVMVKICGDLLGPVYVIDYSTEKTIWSGRPGDTAVFDIPKPTHVYFHWGLGSRRGQRHNYNYTVEAGGRYELTYAQGFWSAEIVLRRVDVIDAGR